MAKKRTRYTDEFRASAVLMLRAAGYPEARGSLAAVSARVGVAGTTLRRWLTKEQNPPPERMLEWKAKESGIQRYIETIFTEAKQGAAIVEAALPGPSSYTERQLTDWVMVNVEIILKTLGLPAAQSVVKEYVLPSGKRLDVVATHEKSRHTFFEVKTRGKGKYKPSHHNLYSAIGQSLYYLSIITAYYMVPDGNINVVIVSDYEADEYFYRCLEYVNHRIYFINIAPFLQTSGGKNNAQEPLF